MHENLVETRGLSSTIDDGEDSNISEWKETILEIFGDLSVACTCGSGHINMSSKNQETDTTLIRPIRDDLDLVSPPLTFVIRTRGQDEREHDRPDEGDEVDEDPFEVRGHEGLAHHGGG